MFNELIESKPKKQRSLGSSTASIVVHAGLIALVVYATAHAGVEEIKNRVEEVKFIEIKPEPAPEPEIPKEAPPPDVVAAPPPPKGFQVLTAPVEIPDVIPEVDLSKAVTNEEDFSGKGVQGGVSRGVVGGTGPVNQDQPYFEFQVEKPVLAREGNPPPRYPEMLRTGGIEGEVLAQFVVDTLGRAELGTLKILKSTHDLFAAAVRQNLPQMRFYAAETGGRKVKQLVQMPFNFTLNR